jgi:hypothetical protein
MDGDPVGAGFGFRFGHRRRARARRWLRALWPLLPLLGAVLASVGVIQVVEYTPAPPEAEEAKAVDVKPSTLEAVEHLDPELFDERLFWDESRLRRAASEERRQIVLRDAEAQRQEKGKSTLSEVLPRSFLDRDLAGAERAPLGEEPARGGPPSD